MKLCYFDAFSGISGDMTVGALIDAGAPADAVLDALRSLETGAIFMTGKVMRGGIDATKFMVDTAGAAKPHRHIHHILEMIEKSAIPARSKHDAGRVFQCLGEAEAAVHGVPISKVHFHEVGAVDSIADIVGACVALHLLGVDQIHASAINVGSGTVKTEHGILPVPAPATATLLKEKPIYSRGPEMELTTPTGAAILAALGTGFGKMPAMKIASIGYGAGDKNFPDQPNVLRALIGEAARAAESILVSVLEANIDDSSPQVLGYALEKLMAAGALDVSLSPLQMKKNRPGSLLRVIAKPEDQERLAAIVFAETSTLGLRIHTAERRVQERQVVEVATPLGSVRIKVSGSGFAPEYEDCRAIAERTGTPLVEVIAAANQAYLKTK
jgi:uncharacterized protein (TIGR00299 family) protein